ncbi:MAG: isoleucine--tRNA ligase [Actinomycetota bacterium]|nr:isoleucine--tRNA ligase [Actinomycetota bacterium]
MPPDQPVHRPVDPRASLPELERRVLERWRQRDVFAESIRARAGAPPWGFYEGPPTANGPPAAHHVLARVFKDIFPRYKTMRGFYVERKGGWDCHGLPVELAVEEELGFTSKEDIERFGIAEFNARCREKVLSHVEDWKALTERIGFWIDTDDAYRTLDPGYVESVWWALKTIHEQGRLYEKLKVVPYCPRCGTALSSHELGQPGVYQDVIDESVYVRLPMLGPAGTEPAGAPNGSVREGDGLLIWTTTPWTLPGNVAVAVAPGIEYVRARHGGETLILAAARVQRVLGEQAEIVGRFPGSELIGRHYEGPILNLSDRQQGGFPIIAGDFVTAEEGTGLVHLAPAFGEDDFDAAADAGLFDSAKPHEVYNPVKPDGTFDHRLRDHDGRFYEGRFVKDAGVTADLIEDLEARGRLLRSEPYEHAYPHCWRCGTPLLYYAKPSWYIATSAVRERMLGANETIGWNPEHVKHGRFGNWLEGNVDWALSRERYWGTPLPVWRCGQGHLRVIGSLAELRDYSGATLADPHRPFVDEIEFPCAGCGEVMRRVPEVIDVWFDSGSMPFAQYGSPHAGSERFQERFPADFICEALDQTRGWFYSLLAVSTLLFDRSSYRNVVCLGLILDERGRKMSKSLGNTVEPWEVIDTYGADALRWYFFTSKQPWDGYRFSLHAIGEAVRQFLLQLWNTYGFFVLYANANGIERRAVCAEAAGEGGPGRDSAPALGAEREPALGGEREPASELDRWVLSRLAATVEVVGERLDEFDATAAGRALGAFVDELSNWYVRRSRRLFWNGSPSAFATLWECLVTVAKLLAPFCPFIADEIYDNLDGTRASVHLCDFPRAGARDPELESDMELARQTVALGLAARGQAKLKVRQPLRAAVVVATGRERAGIERMGAVVREELNVRELRFVSKADELGEVEVKPNYRSLGPRFGRQMPLLAAAVAGLDPAHAAAALRDGRGVGVSVAGGDHGLAAEDLIVAIKPLAGYQVEREGSHAVALELELDEELRIEGRAREIVHAVQAARRDAGLQVSDRIVLSLDGDEVLMDAARAHQGYVAGETLAVQVGYEPLAGVKPGRVDGCELRVGVMLA